MAGVNGAAVKVLRDKDGQSATEFAKRLGISLSYLGDIEAGRSNLRRNPGLIKRIAEALNVPVSSIEKRGDDEAQAVAS